MIQFITRTVTVFFFRHFIFTCVNICEICETYFMYLAHIKHHVTFDSFTYMHVVFGHVSLYIHMMEADGF